MLQEAIEQLPDRDEVLRELGLQTRRSSLPAWLAASVGFLGMGLGVAFYRDELLRFAGVEKPKRASLWTTLGSALLGAGAGAALYAMLAESAKHAGKTAPNPGASTGER
jgi:hypothetical protein